MPQTQKTFGTGIEHEFIMFRDDGNNFTELSEVNTPRGGWRDSEYVYTANNRIQNQRSVDLREGDKLVVVGIDPSVSRSGGYELATMGWKNKKIEHQVAKIKKAEEYITRKNQQAHPNERVRYFPFGSYALTSNSGPGSYHFHFTLPYLPTDSEMVQKERVKKFIGHIQWIEPILIAATHGLSPKSIGDTGKEPEGSIRIARNAYGNPGGFDIDALPDSFPGREDRSYYPKGRTQNHWSKIVQIYNPQRNPYKHGDIVKSGKGGPATMEVRLFDQFDSKHLEPFLKTLIYAGSNGVDRNIEITKKAPAMTEWNKAMANVLEEGWNANIPEKYVKTLREQLQLPVQRSTESLRAIDVLQEVSKDLWEKNKNNEIPKLMLVNRNSAPKIHPVNRDAWAFIFRRHLRVHSTIKNKFKNFLKDLINIDTSESRGYIGAGKYDDEHQGIIHLVHKYFGKEYSSEDVRDILDFLEYEGMIEIVRDSTGHISKIKPLYTASELDEKFNVIVTNAKFFKDDPKFEATTRRAPRVARGRFTVKVGDTVRIRQGLSDSDLNSDILIAARNNQASGVVTRRRRGFSTRPDRPLIAVDFPEGSGLLSLNQLEPSGEAISTRPTRPRPTRPIRPTPRVGGEIRVADEVRIRLGESMPSNEATIIQTNRETGVVNTITGSIARVAFRDRTLDLDVNFLERAGRMEAPTPTPHQFNENDWVRVHWTTPRALNKPGKITNIVLGPVIRENKYDIKYFAITNTILREARASSNYLSHSAPNRTLTMRVPYERITRLATSSEVYREEERIRNLGGVTARRVPSPTEEIIRQGTTTERQIARKMSILKALVRTFLQARTATTQERDDLRWISEYRVDVRNTALRNDYERALREYNSAKEARRQRTGRGRTTREFGRAGRAYKGRRGSGWYVRGEDGDIKKKEIIRHKIAGIKGWKGR